MRYVALLRGIRPGNPNMRNEMLRQVCRDLGYLNVQTVISSGNVLFETNDRDIRRLETNLEAAWMDQLGFASTTIIRTLPEIRALVDEKPFGRRTHTEKSYLLMTFAQEPIPPDFDAEQPLPDAPFRIVGVSEREIFSVSDTTKSAGPQAMAWLETALGDRITSRTWLTVNRILHKMAG